jgi:hypothetical protein
MRGLPEMPIRICGSYSFGRATHRYIFAVDFTKVRNHLSSPDGKSTMRWPTRSASKEYAPGPSSMSASAFNIYIVTNPVLDTPRSRSDHGAAVARGCPLSTIQVETAVPSSSPGTVDRLCTSPRTLKKLSPASRILSGWPRVWSINTPLST